jgi:AcrR family transcriptional regulator
VETKTPRRRLGRAERERQILDAAVAVFSERGFQQASMDAVAERVGVTKPVLYTHFGSKDGLLLACIARARADLLQVTQSAVAAATNPEDALRRGTRAFFDYLDGLGPAWMLLYSETTDGGEALEAVRQQQVDFITGLLMASKPGVDQQRVEGWAQIIVGATERLALWRARTGGITAEQATQYLMDLAWTGLERGPAGVPAES